MYEGYFATELNPNLLAASESLRKIAASCSPPCLANLYRDLWLFEDLPHPVRLEGDSFPLDFIDGSFRLLEDRKGVHVFRRLPESLGVEHGGRIFIKYDFGHIVEHEQAVRGNGALRIIRPESSILYLEENDQVVYLDRSPDGISVWRR